MVVESRTANVAGKGVGLFGVGESQRRRGSRVMPVEGKDPWFWCVWTAELISDRSAISPHRDAPHRE
jgi:hypothetical protein